MKGTNLGRESVKRNREQEKDEGKSWWKKCYVASTHKYKQTCTWKCHIIFVWFNSRWGRKGWEGAVGERIWWVWCGCSWRKRGLSRTGGWVSGERLLPLLLRLIKTAPTFFLNHPASQRTKHFSQCLYFVKQWQVGCQRPLWPCYRGTIPQGLCCHAKLLPLLWVHKWCKNTWKQM